MVHEGSSVVGVYMDREIGNFDEYFDMKGRMDDFKNRVLDVFDSLQHVCKYDVVDIRISESRDKEYIDIMVRYSYDSYRTGTLKRSIIETALSGNIEAAREMYNNDAYGKVIS